MKMKMNLLDLTNLKTQIDETCEEVATKTKRYLDSTRPNNQIRICYHVHYPKPCFSIFEQTGNVTIREEKEGNVWWSIQEDVEEEAVKNIKLGMMNLMLETKVEIGKDLPRWNSHTGKWENCTIGYAEAQKDITDKLMDMEFDEAWCWAKDNNADFEVVLSGSQNKPTKLQTIAFMIKAYHEFREAQPDKDNYVTEARYSEMLRKEPPEAGEWTEDNIKYADFGWLTIKDVGV